MILIKKTALEMHFCGNPWQADHWKLEDRDGEQGSEFQIIRKQHTDVNAQDLSKTCWFFSLQRAMMTLNDITQSFTHSDDVVPLAVRISVFHCVESLREEFFGNVPHQRPSFRMLRTWTRCAGWGKIWLVVQCVQFWKQILEQIK